MAARCLSYLSFDCFREDITAKDIADYLEQGEYLWLDYVHKYWLEHLKQAVREPNKESGPLVSLVQGFVRRWKRTPEPPESISLNNGISFGFDCFKQHSPDEYGVLCRAAQYKSQSKRLEIDQGKFDIESSFIFCRR